MGMIINIKKLKLRPIANYIINVTINLSIMLSFLLTFIVLAIATNPCVNYEGGYIFGSNHDGNIIIDTWASENGDIVSMMCTVYKNPQVVVSSIMFFPSNQGTLSNSLTSGDPCKPFKGGVVYGTNIKGDVLNSTVANSNDEILLLLCEFYSNPMVTQCNVMFYAN